MTPWTVSRQAPLFMGFPRQEYWNGSPFPSPGDLPDPGIEPVSPALAGGSLPLSHLGSPKLIHSFQFSLSVVSDSFATSWTVATQVPLSMGFPRQEYWNGLPFTSPGISLT